MRDIQNAAFVLSVIFGITLIPLLIPAWSRVDKYLRESEKFDIAGLLGKRFRFLSVLSPVKNEILLLFVFFVVFATAVYLVTKSVNYSLSADPLNSYLVVRSWVLVFANIVLDLTIGVLSGVLIWQFWKAVNTAKEMTVWTFTARLVPVVALLGFGLFRDEISNLAQYVKAVETSYVKVSFERRDPEKELIFRGTESPIHTDTDFKSGLKGYQWSVKAPLKHIIRIYDLCGPSSEHRDSDEPGSVSTVCIPPYNIEAREGDLETLELIIGYAKTVLGYQSCMNVFLDYFPGGVPIQEEVSEIAIDYVNSLTETSDGEDSSFLPATHHDNIDKIFKNFARIANLDVANKGKTQASPECSEISIESIVNFRDKYRTIIRNFRKKHDKEIVETKRILSDTNVSEPVGFADYFPYRAMIDASLLQMSGYAREAAHHIQRQADNWLFLHGLEERLTEDKTEREFSADSFVGLDLLTFQAGLEMLGLQEYIFDRAGLFSELPIVRASLKDYVGTYLSSNTTLNFNPTGIDAVHSALKACQKDDDDDVEITFEPNTGKPPLVRSYFVRRPFDEISEDTILEYHSLTQGNPQAKSRLQESEKEYVTNLLYYWVHLTLRNLRSISNSDKRIPQNKLEEAERLYAIAIKEPELIQNCFKTHIQDNRQLGAYDWRVIRTRFAFTYSELLAFSAQQANDEKLLRAPDDPKLGREVNRLLCKTQEAVRITLKLAEDVLQGDLRSPLDFHDTVINEQVQSARSILRDLPLREQDC